MQALILVLFTLIAFLIILAGLVAIAIHVFPGE